MIDFEPSFFEGETRDGFYIEPMMKRAWAVELEVLSRVSAVCKKYEIPYVASYGTLLGAIRHHGYIPWDDDIDIALPRKDYEKMLEVIKKDYSHKYTIADAREMENYPLMTARIMIKGTKFLLC